MAESAKKQWGLTPALSESLPTNTDMAKNAELVEELKRENNYEGSAETSQRIETLKLLQRVTQEFVREVSRRQGFQQSQIDQFGGKVYPYGSYRLGVYGPGMLFIIFRNTKVWHDWSILLGSDIDTLAVAPRHVKREDFFEFFPPTLKRMTPPNAVSSLTPVPEAYVPIIKLVLNDIEIDLIFVSIASLQTIPKDLELKDNKLLDGLDTAGVRAITGPRVTDEILSLIPEAKAFRTALRAIKLWAQRRAIYANIVGYPGGVAWAMLVARVCQLYPRANGAMIANRFFFVMRDWKWPTPIMLKEIETGKEKVWNPKIYPQDKKNIMPIITPAYPSMCATYNISISGKTVITRELERGKQITDAIFNGTMQWKDLFKKHSFFTTDHKYYLSIIVSSADQDAAKAFSGLVESKVRILVKNIEDDQHEVISLARPYTKGFKRVHKVENAEQTAEVRKGIMKYKVDETVLVETTDPQLVTMNGDGVSTADAQGTQQSSTEGGQKVFTHTFYVGLDLTDKAKQNLNISAPIQNFKAQCWTWPSYNQNIHDLDIVPCKSYELPDDVFGEGETKPTKPKKSKKRLASELGNAADGNNPKRPALTNGHRSSSTILKSTEMATASPAPSTPITPAPAWICHLPIFFEHLI